MLDGPPLERGAEVPGPSLPHAHEGVVLGPGSRRAQAPELTQSERAQDGVTSTESAQVVADVGGDAVHG